MLQRYRKFITFTQAC